MEVTELKFQIRNLEKQIQIKDNLIDDLIMSEEMKEQNLKVEREKRRKFQTEKELL